jgi:hypothetical protein
VFNPYQRCRDTLARDFTQAGHFSTSSLIFLWIGSIMKKFALIALLATSSVAFAGGGHGHGHGGSTGPVIDGPSLQVAVFNKSSVSNTASGSQADAKQNISSNSGNVKVEAAQIQLTTTDKSAVTNKASGGDSYAKQNLSSNDGSVKIDAASIQVTSAKNSHIANLASGYKTSAVQNIASNNGCDKCQ